MVVQRRVKKQHSFLKIVAVVAVALLVLCIVGLLIVAVGSLAMQFF